MLLLRFLKIAPITNSISSRASGDALSNRPQHSDFILGQKQDAASALILSDPAECEPLKKRTTMKAFCSWRPAFTAQEDRNPLQAIILKEHLHQRIKNAL